MTDTDDTGLTDRVCAWCRARAGHDHFELIDRSGGGTDTDHGRVFCTRDCLVSAVMDTNGGAFA